MDNSHKLKWKMIKDEKPKNGQKILIRLENCSAYFKSADGSIKPWREYLATFENNVFIGHGPLSCEISDVKAWAII